jgi:hypothetical protein
MPEDFWISAETQELIEGRDRSRKNQRLQTDRTRVIAIDTDPN